MNKPRTEEKWHFAELHRWDILQLKTVWFSNSAVSCGSGFRSKKPATGDSLQKRQKMPARKDIAEITKYQVIIRKSFTLLPTCISIPALLERTWQTFRDHSVAPPPPSHVTLSTDRHLTTAYPVIPLCGFDYRLAQDTFPPRQRQIFLQCRATTHHDWQLALARTPNHMAQCVPTCQSRSLTLQYAP